MLAMAGFLDFLTQSELIEPVLSLAAQLGIHFYCFQNSQAEMHLL